MTETKDTLALRRLRIITDGIDSTEIAREEGWWATDKGATFGRQKLAELENLVMCLEAERDAAQEVAAMNARSGASWAARVQELESQLEAIGAGGVEPLRRRECLHKIAEPGGWISVDERLPEPNVEVLCAGQGLGDPYVTACYYDDERREWYPVNTHWTDSTGSAQYPTHWMPLPPSPSSADEGGGNG